MLKFINTQIQIDSLYKNRATQSENEDGDLNGDLRRRIRKHLGWSCQKEVVIDVRLAEEVQSRTYGWRSVKPKNLRAATAATSFGTSPKRSQLDSQAAS